MAKRAATLKAKHAGRLTHEPPQLINEFSWRVFTEYVREGRPVREISRRTGLSASKIGLIVNLVDQALAPPRGDRSSGGMTLESPVDDLMLSTRSLNALHELQCDNIASVLRKDFSRVRTRLRLGRVTRWEIATALASRGFDPPASLLPVDPRTESLATEIRKLRRRVDDDHRFWKQQLRTLEDRLRGRSRTELGSLAGAMDAH